MAFTARVRQAYDSYCARPAGEIAALIFFGDGPVADRTFLARFLPRGVKEEIQRYSKKLGLSQNDLILHGGA